MTGASVPRAPFRTFGLVGWRWNRSPGLSDRGTSPEALDFGAVIG